MLNIQIQKESRVFRKSRKIVDFSYYRSDFGTQTSFMISKDNKTQCGTWLDYRELIELDSECSMIGRGDYVGHETDLKFRLSKVYNRTLVLNNLGAAPRRSFSGDLRNGFSFRITDVSERMQMVYSIPIMGMLVDNCIKNYINDPNTATASYIDLGFKLDNTKRVSCVSHNRKGLKKLNLLPNVCDYFDKFRLAMRLTKNHIDIRYNYQRTWSDFTSFRVNSTLKTGAYIGESRVNYLNTKYKMSPMENARKYFKFKILS